jgi:hypothetical protein
LTGGSAGCVIEPRKDAKVSVADAVGRESGRRNRPER